MEPAIEAVAADGVQVLNGKTLTTVAALRPLLEPTPSVTQGLNEGTDHRISTQRLK